MNKKKAIALTLAAILLLYALTLGALFLQALSAVRQEIRTEILDAVRGDGMSGLMNDLARGEETDMGYDAGTTAFLVIKEAVITAGLRPCDVRIYGSDGALLAESGPFVTLFADGREIAIPLAPWLDEEEALSIRERSSIGLWGLGRRSGNTIDVNTAMVNDFRYVKVDGAFLPVSMIVNRFSGEVDSSSGVPIGEDPVTIELAAGAAAVPGAEVLTGEEPHLFPMVLTASAREERFYDRAQELVDELVEKETRMSAGAHYNDSASCRGYRSLTIGGEACTIFYAFTPDFKGEALASPLFRSSLLTASLLYAAALAAALFAVSRLADRENALRESQRAFTAATAHEMKTPLAIIQNQCELLLEDAVPEKREEILRSIYDESLRMNASVERFLRYDRLLASGTIEETSFDLSALTGEEWSRYASRMRERGLSPAAEIAEGLTVTGDPALLRLALDNYLSNALKHTSPGGRVSATLRAEGDGVRFELFNTAAAFTDKEKKAVWEPLWRGDSSRHRDGSSGGMGLSLAGRIFKRCGAEYGCYNERDGVVFYFFLKR